MADVPDWTAMRDDDDLPYPVFWLEMQSWLKNRGYAFAEIQLSKLTWMPLPFPCYAIFIGPHRTGARHAIVGQCEDGRFIPLHDPLGGHPREAFLGGHVEAVCFLVPIDPAAHKFKSAEDRAALRAARANEAKLNAKKPDTGGPGAG